jgi:hypothetical protein
MTPRIATTASGRADRTGAHVAQLGDLLLNPGTLLFEFGQSFGHGMAPP